MSEVRNTLRLQDKIKKLEQEKAGLQKKLDLCQRWMKREIESQVHTIAKGKLGKLTQESKAVFLRENQEKIILQQLEGYFGDMLLLNAPKRTLEYLVDSEINYYNMQRNENLDGMVVVNSYHKVLDICIEAFITKGYRRFASKKGQTQLYVNDPLEKALHLVVNKKYILSMGRLFGLLKSIRENEEMYHYTRVFREYFQKYPEIGEVFLSNTFFDSFDCLIRMGVFGSKRHTGKISFQETKKARTYFTGDYEKKYSLLRMVLESQLITY